MVGHTALGAGGPGSIPPWRALSKSRLFPSKNTPNACIRSSKPEKVIILTTDENLPRAVAQGLCLGSLGNPGEAGLQGGSGPVVGHTALGAGGPGSIPPWRALPKSLVYGGESIKNADIRPSELEKVKKASHRSVTRVTKYCKTHLKCAKWNSFLKSRGSPGSRGPGVRECGWDPPFHTRRGPG